MIRKVYVDMDGVLVNFNKKKFELAVDHPEILDDHKGLWEVIDTIPHFFSTLEPMEDAFALMGYLESLRVPIAILTALPRRKEIRDAEEDKRSWVHKYFGNMEFHIGPYAVNKQEFCEPGFVLIDDSRLNIPQWNARGGFGILHQDFISTKKAVENILQKN